MSVSMQRQDSSWTNHSNCFCKMRSLKKLRKEQTQCGEYFRCGLSTHLQDSLVEMGDVEAETAQGLLERNILRNHRFINETILCCSHMAAMLGNTVHAGPTSTAIRSNLQPRHLHPLPATAASAKVA